MSIALIALDADDTLWHSQTLFDQAHEDFANLLAPFSPAQDIVDRLAATEEHNLRHYGYGTKGFTLSMIETAIEISQGRVSTAALKTILELGRSMLDHPIDLLPGVAQALPRLALRARLILISKGDLFHQESKLAASGLGDLFSGVEIVSDKTPAIYARIFARYGISPEHALMAGNSIRSDILPPLACGSYAALIPYHLVWMHEAAEAPLDHPRFCQLASLSELPDWIDTLAT